MNIEDTLRDALSAEAAEATPAPDAWARLAGAAAEAKQRQRRRLWLGGGLATVAAALVVALLATTMVDSSRRQGLRMTDDPDTQPTAPTTPTTSTDPSVTTQSPPAVVLPDTVIAYSARGRVVEVSTATGSAVRTIVNTKYNADDTSIGNVDVSPDGKTVYYDGVDGVWQVARTGGPQERIGDGRLPVLSPDGKTLAYTRESLGSSLVLRDLATGQEKVLRRSEDEGPISIGTMSWGPTGTELVLFAGWEGNESAVRINPQTATSLDRPEIVSHPKDVPQGSYLRAHQHVSGARYLAVHACCLREPQGEAEGRMELDLKWHRLAVVTADGRYEAQKVDVGARRIRSLSVDGRGRYAAYVVDGELYGLDVEGAAPPKQLGTGFVSAVFPRG